MKPAQFDAIAKLISSREPTKSAARRVLVDGSAPVDAAREFDISRQSVGNTVARFKAAEDTILTAYKPIEKSA
ncbi:hypothetical protein ACFQAT_28305 [Undibacterium arcticum]|uniref:TrfB transcriptional repressor protein domain-containing protein n=1 Tax=Undibacterium arcticum TaxID=1762892 RepID=A0ABV7F9U2_9BURK